MSGTLLLLFSLLLLLIVISAFFSGAEIGIMSLNRYRLKYLVKKKDSRAIYVSDMLQRPDKLLSVLIIGNTLANIIASTVATLIGDKLYGAIGVAVTTAILSLIILVFAEMIPKTIAAMHPEKIALTCAYALRILQSLMSPLVYLVSLLTKSILHISEKNFENQNQNALSSEELRSVVNEAAGLLPYEHKSMLISLLDLEELKVEDIMIPAADIIGIDLEKSWEDILYQLETAQHTRLPLYKDSIHHLLGMIHLRDVLNLTLAKVLTKEDLLKIADQPYYIPEGTPLNTQILNFQKEKRRSCFIVNEYGYLQGLVTMEDILEEVVGEFTTDISTLTTDIIQQEKDLMIIDASITLRNLQRMLGWELPMLGPKTLSGLIIEYLGYIPTSPCCLTIENYQIEILKVGDHMIKTVQMRRLPI